VNNVIFYTYMNDILLTSIWYVNLNLGLYLNFACTIFDESQIIVFYF